MGRRKQQLILKNNGDLFARVVSILDKARSNVVRTVNSSMITAYWLIGREIVQELQGGKERAKYGKEIIEILSNQLTERYGEGFSATNLKHFRTFYQVYADRLSSIQYPVGTELEAAFKSLSKIPIRHPLGDELNTALKRLPKAGQGHMGTEVNTLSEPIRKSHPVGDQLTPRFHPNLTWSHYRALMRVEKETARHFYEKEAIACGWSKRELERQIDSFYYERLLASKDKKLLINERKKKNNNTKLLPVDVLKSPTILEFLNLPNDAQLHESTFEQAIIDNLQSFLLELGKGFAFVSRQQHLRYEDEDFYVDLVFYNYLLKCFVLVDLKMGKLSHQDVGQMDSYIRMYEDLFKVKGDNPTIGLILCAKKNETIAKYSVLKENKQLFAAKYMLYLPTEEQLANELEREQWLIEEQHADRR